LVRYRFFPSFSLSRSLSLSLARSLLLSLSLSDLLLSLSRVRSLVRTRFVGSLKLYVSFVECSLFYRALWQKRLIIFKKPTNRREVRRSIQRGAPMCAYLSRTCALTCALPLARALSRAPSLSVLVCPCFGQGQRWPLLSPH